MAFKLQCLIAHGKSVQIKTARGVGPENGHSTKEVGGGGIKVLEKTASYFEQSTNTNKPNNKTIRRLEND
jgi:hypothetical protein